MDKAAPEKTTIIAVCGKGGVGKTTVSAVITRILCGDIKNKILAIDADPAVGLSSALGISARKTVDDIRNLLIKKAESKTAGDRNQVLSMIDYEVFDALVEKDNLAFLAIGRPESEGCYCRVNELLKDIIKSISGSFNYVIIDGEAGIEQINRRVMESVTHLITVSDASQKGLNVARTILDVSRDAVRFDTSGLILNRIAPGTDVHKLQIPASLNLSGWIDEDELIREYDIQGRSLLELPPCAAVASVERCLEKMKMI